MTRDIAIGQSGDQVTGECRTDEFVLKSSFGTMTLHRQHIRQIELRSPNGLKIDDVTMKNMDHHVGTLLNETIEFRTDDGHELSIPRTTLRALLLNWGFTESAKRLR